uniref:uncharacterized protein LOC120339989 n=1 Tax=Styela clava TaxID=7725 RepID=UPI00193A0482|nr:uncharacterized protein LOC120339989 [Styela clava]
MGSNMSLQIILSLRESDDEWLESLEKQMKASGGIRAIKLMTFLSPTYRNILIKTGRPASLIMFGMENISSISHRPYNKDMLKLKYRAHNAHVLQNAPPDKLLVYKVTEGWDPLCKFLGVPIPDETFPHKNKAGIIIREMLATHPILIKMKREMLISSAILATSLSIGGFFVYKRGFRNIIRPIINFVQNIFPNNYF